MAPRLDEDENSGRIVHRLLEVVSVLVTDCALQNEEHDLETDVDMYERDCTRRYRRNVHREFLGADVLGSHPGLVANSVLASVGVGVTQAEDAVAVLRGRREFFFVHYRIIASSASGLLAS